MNIAIAQINTRAADFASVSERMEAISISAAGQGVELLVFPLAALCGQAPVDYPDREGYQIDLFHTLRQLALTVACPCLVPVVTEMDGESFHEVILLEDGDIVPLRARAYVEAARQDRERHGADAERMRELSPYVSTFELGNMQFAVALTYEDMDDLIDASLELDAVVFVSDYAYALDDPSSVLGAALKENRFVGDAQALDAWVVAVGSVGGYGTQVFSGSSHVVSPRGELVASAPAFEEALVSVELQEYDEQGTYAVSALEPELYNRTLHLWEALSLGLRDYVEKGGRAGVALSMDASLSSLLLAALASDALGPERVHALLGVADADAEAGVVQAVADALHLSLAPCEVDLASVSDDALRSDLVNACVAHAARSAHLVPLSGEDKTFLALEAAPGSCKAAELLPFGDVYRSDVIELAHLRNTISPVLPKESFAWFSVPGVGGLEEAEPTPALRLKRADVTLSTYVEWERPLTDVAARQGNPEVCCAIARRLRDCQPAREGWPPSLVASSRPLFMARGPMGSAWRDTVREDEERLHGSDLVRRLLPPDDDLLPPQEVSDEEIASMLEELELELRGGNLPAGASGANQESLEGALGELMGLLQDLLQNGEQPPADGGPFGPLTWGSPFSEN